MNSYLHIIFSYLCRFWREVIALYLVSITGSLWLAMQPSSLPSSAFTVMELAAWLWFTMRLMQAESTFTTLGGWQLRPLRRFMIPVAQWLCYLIVVVPLIAVRVVAIPLIAEHPREIWVESVFGEFGVMLLSVILAALI
jgi:hypothetical protein